MKKIVVILVLLFPIIMVAQETIHKHLMIGANGINDEKCLRLFPSQENTLNLYLKALNLSDGNNGIFQLPPSIGDLFLSLSLRDLDGNQIHLGNRGPLKNFEEIEDEDFIFFKSDGVDFSLNTVYNDIIDLIRVNCTDSTQSITLSFNVEIRTFNAQTNSFQLADLSDYSDDGGIFDRNEFNFEFSPANPKINLYLNFCCGPGKEEKTEISPRISTNSHNNFTKAFSYNDLSPQRKSFIVVSLEGKIIGKSNDRASALRIINSMPGHFFLLHNENGIIKKKEVLIK